jgi:cysteine-rich repeat protein
MRNQGLHPGRARVAMAVALGASALALAGPAGADTKASIACRGAIAKGLSGIPNSGFKLNDKCHKTQDKLSAATGACNDVSNSLFDPKGQYAKAKTKSSGLISKKCLAGDPVLGNYDGSNPETAVEPVIDDAVGGNSAAVVGNANLNGDKAKTKCVETIGKSRTGIFKEILKNSTKCQANRDKTASTFGALDPSCVDPGTKSVGKATLKIPEACTGLTVLDTGSCDPLPGCVTDAAVTSAQGIAKAIYQKVAPPSQCGNGTVEGAEQCDDGAANGTPGDLCNLQCESLAETCGPGTLAGGTIIGHRILTVSLHIPDKNGQPQKLAGARVNFDYPQLEASIKGTGLSSVVQTSFQVLQNSPSGFLALANDTDTDASIIVSSSDAFIDSTSGAFLQVTLDECTPLSTNICNRNQQVTGCCPTTDIIACNAAPDDPVACFCGANGKISQADCNTAGCTLGVCVGIPPGNPGDCVSGKCSPTSANPGKACTPANEALTCSGVPVDQATCTANHACSRLGDQTNGTYGCGSIFNPPGAPNGSFGNPGPVGPPTVPPALPGSCPTNNTCTDQAQLTAASCTVAQPVDAFGQPVDGVTCSIDVTEAP